MRKSDTFGGTMYFAGNGTWSLDSANQRSKQFHHFQIRTLQSFQWATNSLSSSINEHNRTIGKLLQRTAKVYLPQFQICWKNLIDPFSISHNNFQFFRRFGDVFQALINFLSRKSEVNLIIAWDHVFMISKN